MSKAVVSASMLMMMISGFMPALAEEPGAVVVAIYGKHPWTDLPPGGHGAWYVDTAVAWEQGASDAGMTFLLGKIRKVGGVETEIVASGSYEARVRAVVSGEDGTAQVLNFGMIGDDDEDDRWRIIEVFTDDGKYLSEVLAGD